MIELWFLIICILIIFGILYVQKQQEHPVEGFTSFLAGCPPSYKTFYQEDGTVGCCLGEVVGTQCLSEMQCTLGAARPGMPTCIGLMQQEASSMSSANCPNAMRQYFRDAANQKQGCTDGPLNASITGPLRTTQPTCYIYATDSDNMNKADSCQNQKSKETAERGFPSPDFMVIPIQPDPTLPVLMMVKFNDKMGVPRSAYTKASLTAYLTATGKLANIDMTKSIDVAENAKAFFYDKTKSASDVTI